MSTSFVQNPLHQNTVVDAVSSAEIKTDITDPSNAANITDNTKNTVVDAVSSTEIKTDITDPSNAAKITDNTIRNSGKISGAMQFSSENAASAFTDISKILNGGGTNEEKKVKIVDKSKDVRDTILQVFANMAIGILGSSKEGAVDEKEPPGIEKLSKAFSFLGHKIDDKNDSDKDKRLKDTAEAFIGLINDKDIDEDTKKSIETSFKKTPDIAKIAQIQEGVENKDPEKSKDEQTPNNNSQSLESASTDNLRDPSSYDGKDWEDFYKNAIYCARGAIAIGLLFAPGGIFLAPLFLWATKDLGRSSEEIEQEQKELEEAKIQSKENLGLLLKQVIEYLPDPIQYLQDFKNYLLGPKKVNQNEFDEQGEDLKPPVNNSSNQPQPIQKKPDEITSTGIEAQEFVDKENASLQRTHETLEANQKSLNRVGSEDIKKTDTIIIDRDSDVALNQIIGGLSQTNLKDKDKDETTSHGVSTTKVGGVVVGGSAKGA